MTSIFLALRNWQEENKQKRTKEEIFEININNIKLSRIEKLTGVTQKENGKKKKFMK